MRGPGARASITKGYVSNEVACLAVAWLMLSILALCDICVFLAIRLCRVVGC